MPFEEAGEAKGEAVNWVAVSKECGDEYGKAVEGYLCITPLFDRGNVVVLEEIGSVVYGWHGSPLEEGVTGAGDGRVVTGNRGKVDHGETGYRRASGVLGKVQVHELQ